MRVMVIDCGTCEVAGLACEDCVVSVLLGMPEVRAGAELPDDHVSAISVLSESGLVPPLRLISGQQAV